MIGSIVPILIRRQTQAMWRQSMLTISIISIGVAVMILLGSLVNALADKMLMLGIAARPHAQILALAHEDGGSTAARSTAPAAPTIPHWRSLIETIEHGIPDAKAAGMVIGVGDVRIGSHREAVTISGIDPQRHPDIIALPSWTLRGSPWAMDQASVLIGVSLAKRLGVDVGDDLIVAAGDRRGSTLRIVAVLSSGFQVVDDGQVFIEMSTASEMLGLAGQATDIAIRFADPLQAAGWADRLRAWSGNRVRVWSDDNRQAEVGLLVQSAIAWTIRVAMAIAIAVSITSITSLAIISRQREIGIHGLDVLPDALAVSLVNRYLDLKARGSL